MQTATRHFQTISATLRELNQAGLRMQTVNDLLTMYVGAASQHARRTTFVPFEAADSSDKEIVAYWSQLAGRDVAFTLFHLPLRMGGLGVGSAVHRHAAAPWTAWHSIIPTLQETTGDIDSLFTPTPFLRGQLRQLQVTVSQQMDTPSLLLKSLGAALRTHGTQKVLVNTIQQVSHTNSSFTCLSTNNIQKAILISPTAKNTGPHLQQPSSEAYEADDRCFQVSLARRLMLPHPAASHAANILPTCPNVSAAKRTCACPIDDYQLHCMICKSGGGVDQRHSALARCHAYLITTHTGTKAYIEPLYSVSFLDGSI